MKSLFSENYYRDNWDEFIERKNDRHYIDMEADLALLMKGFEEAGLPEEALAIIRKQQAQKVAEMAMKMILEDFELAKRVDAGKACFGMTTVRQEEEVKFNFRTRFDFNCLQLADFRKKYL